MGVKEESAPFKLLKGYSAALLPNHTKAGKCGKCRKPVFVKGNYKPSGKAYQGTIYIHYSCEVISKLQTEISQIIPVPSYKA